MVCFAETIAHKTHNTVAEATSRDETLQAVIDVTMKGWPQERFRVPQKALPYWNVKEELSVYDGVVFRGERVCVPSSMKAKMLEIIHSPHLGIVKSKQRAREVVYWPNMNKEIEDLVSKCETCLQHRNKPAKEPMMIAPIPSLPWSKIGCDLFQLGARNYLVMVDYYSNFIEVAQLSETISREVIENIKSNIARHGLVKTLISDNGPQFSSHEFKKFTEDYEINHVTSSPRHQQANGLAENAVKTIKNLLIKCTETGTDPYLALLELRNTPRNSEMVHQHRD